MDTVAFLRRFLLHLLPSGFMRIRHYGFLANAVRKQSVALCRELLTTGEDDEDAGGRCGREREGWQELLLRLTGLDVTRCPHCKAGRLMPREHIAATKARWSLPGRPSSP